MTMRVSSVSPSLHSKMAVATTLRFQRMLPSRDFPHREDPAQTQVDYRMSGLITALLLLGTMVGACVGGLNGDGVRAAVGALGGFAASFGIGRHFIRMHESIQPKRSDD